MMRCESEVYTQAFCGKLIFLVEFYFYDGIYMDIYCLYDCLVERSKNANALENQ